MPTEAAIWSPLHGASREWVACPMRGLNAAASRSVTGLKRRFNVASAHPVVNDWSRDQQFMQTDELREKYLAFFESKGCTRRPSDVLVPRWDPSVLFTPAGMNQFKDHFLGRCKLIHPRHHLPKVPAHRRYRQRRPHGLPPHVFRDAGQLQLRRLFQTRRDQLGLGVSHPQGVARPGSRPSVGHRLPGR